jgi:hypothetical protein
VLADLEAYPRWYAKGVRRVEVRERDPAGRATKAVLCLYASVGPLRRELEFEANVRVEGERVQVARLPFHAADAETFELRWSVSPAPAGATIELALAADLDVPRMVPTGGAGDSIAGSLTRAAAAEIERGRLPQSEE